MIDLIELGKGDEHARNLKKLSASNDFVFFMGLVVLFIYSKDIFPKNNSIKAFLEVVFKNSFPDYIMKSRTLIVAKATRLILSAEVQKREQYKSNFLEFFGNQEASSRNRNNKKKNENDQFDIWLRKM